MALAEFLHLRYRFNSMRCFITTIVFASLFSPALHAQQNDWQWLDFGLQSGFREDDLRIMPENFQRNDSLWYNQQLLLCCNQALYK